MTRHLATLRLTPGGPALGAGSPLVARAAEAASSTSTLSGGPDYILSLPRETDHRLVCELHPYAPVGHVGLGCVVASIPAAVTPPGRAMEPFRAPLSGQDLATRPRNLAVSLQAIRQS